MGGGCCKTVEPLKAALFSALLLSFLLLSTTFISCAGGAGSPASGGSAEATSLCIQLPSSVEVPAKYLARTAQYEKVDSNFETFTVSITSSSYKSTKSCGRGEKLTFSNIPVGHYDVVALAKKADGAVTAKGTTTVDVEPDVTKTVSISLTRLDYHTVQFLNEDGSVISSQDVSDGYTATKPANPAPSAGKAFSFWTADATVGDSSTPFDFNTPITGDTTLKPVFGVITYTVKYVSPVGTFTASDFTAATASGYSLPSTSSVTGLTFADWYADAAFSTTVDAASVRDVTTFTKKDDLHYEKSIYAKWTATVTFDPRNGGSATTSAPLVYNVDTAADSKPADPTKTGATFLGWYTGTVSGSGATATVTYASTAYNFTTKVTSNITLYAKWGLDISGLSGYLASLPTGSKEEPNVLPAINGLTTSNWTQIKTALTANSSKFVDLSATALPAGITTMEEGFKNCSKLVAAPAIPDSVTNMKYCFSYCSSLTAAPVIPDGVTDMYNCFYQCGSLTAAPAIPDGVTDMSRCFYGCSSLTAAPTIPDGVTNMRYCFDGCSSMTTGPSTIPSGVTDMSYCFRDCSSLTGVIVINAEITDSYNWYGTFVGLHSSLTVKVKSNVLNAVLEGTRLESPYEYPVCNINGMD